ncbi:MAG: biotin/lipoyl-containing protein [Acidilobaceae archaeon]|jgi:pyruvate/2-oxoglutarate dehydrogenase complex dihydrolipoamide acyltransferase (E2) component
MPSKVIKIPEELWPRRGGWRGRVVSVLKKPGDRVSRGEPVVEVEIEKAVLVIESPYDGVVSEVLVSQGSPVEPDSELMRVDVVGEG